MKIRSNILKKKFKYAIQSEHPEIEKFWTKNKKKIMEMAREANAELIAQNGRPLTEEIIHNNFVSNADAIYREPRKVKYTIDETIKATLRLRAYTSEKQFFKQGVAEKIMSDGDYMKQVGIEILKNGQVRFRNNKGIFTGNTLNSITYAGKVDIAGVT